MCTHTNCHQRIEIPFRIRLNDIYIDTNALFHRFVKDKVKFTEICLNMVFYSNPLLVVI